MKTRAAIQLARGEPLIVDELDLPDPRPDQALLQMYSTGICHSQIHEFTDLRARPTAFGHEAAALVMKVGKDVTRVKEGDHAIVTWVRDVPLPFGAEDENCGATYKGSPIPWPHHTWSEHAVISEGYLVPMSKDDPTDLSSIIGCAVLTGCGAIIHTTRVRPEQSVAIIGMGGVGLSAVAAAAMSHASPVIAVDLHADKLDLAIEFGATHTVDASIDDPVEAILELSAGGVDFAFDAVGARPVTEMIHKMTRPGGYGADNFGGTAVLIGVPGKEMSLNPLEFLCKQGSFITSFGASFPDKDFPMYLRWHREGKLPLDKLVTDRFRLDQINEASDALIAGKIRGRAIIEF
ncbi:MAG: zinc-binding dehydrogenase [Boseongicola sp. SB0673_bin_14]|nr:zinc-binding dehydrogenase [Boseongicola sp. SB0667_bin_21]MYI70879.1 zinc-binding dehydrogenase [Boseongicola sp. SB0673_bin_14]